MEQGEEPSRGYGPTVRKMLNDDHEAQESAAGSSLQQRDALTGSLALATRRADPRRYRGSAAYQMGDDRS